MHIMHIIFWLARKPLDCKLTKSVNTLSNLNNSKTIKKTIKSRIKRTNVKKKCKTLLQIVEIFLF